jgi:hypothetical protein
MGSTRKRRRRIERARAKRPARQNRLRPGTRLGLIVAGVVMVVAGAVLLGHGAAANTQRLSRLAGILILVGLVIAAAGLIGRY